MAGNSTQSRQELKLAVTEVRINGAQEIAAPNPGRRIGERSWNSSNCSCEPRSEPPGGRAAAVSIAGFVL